MDSEMIFAEFSEVLLRYAERASPAPDSKFFEVLKKFLENMFHDKKIDLSRIMASPPVGGGSKTPVPPKK